MSKIKFIHKGNLNKSNINKLSKNKPIIYKLKSSSGENIYTGVAKRGRSIDRLLEHLLGAKDSISGAKSFSIKQKNTIKSAELEEKQIIKKEKPKFNK